MNCATHNATIATAYCRSCGKALCEACQRPVNGVVYCEPCLAERLKDPVAAQAGQPRPTAQVILEQGLGLKNVRNPNAVLAAILSIIPGVGAMYNGQFLKGLIYAGAYALLIAMLDHGGGAFAAFILAGFIFYMAFDAYHCAKAIAAGQPVPDPLGLDKIFGVGVGTGTMNPMGQSSAYPPPAAPPTPGHQAQAAPGYQAVPGYQSTPPGAPPTTAYAPVPPPTPVQDLTKAPVGAIVLIGLGVLFFLSSLDVLHINGDMIVPFMLIGIGAWIFVKRWNR